MDNSELKLIHAAKNGDSGAFAALYAQYAEQLYRFALYYMRNPADAEDAVQDAVLQAFRSVSSLRKEDSFRSWLFKILCNVCKKKLTENKNIITDESVQDNPDLCNQESPGLDHAVRLTVREAVAALPPEDRQIVLLSVVAGYTSAEIAAMLGLNAATVRSTKSRSLARLRTMLSEECKNG
ncbi:MAG: sigma-70 family RNA polymerase sigma factor [Clostridia bacterium]|nr:sigma-70 family RNA polymerase sigma factor [Clostridia bacterium]